MFVCFDQLKLALLFLTSTRLDKIFGWLTKIRSDIFFQTNCYVQWDSDKLYCLIYHKPLLNWKKPPKHSLSRKKSFECQLKVFHSMRELSNLETILNTSTKCGQRLISQYSIGTLTSVQVIRIKWVINEGYR